MTDTFSYTRLVEDSNGISHFEDVEVALSDNGRGSVLSDTMGVSGINFRKNHTDYDLDWHPAPRRQFIVNLTGAVQITASDGEVRVFGPGSILLVEDVGGKGHMSKAVGGDQRLSLFVHLP
jgi:hypothetical protein